MDSLSAVEHDLKRLPQPSRPSVVKAGCPVAYAQGCEPKPARQSVMSEKKSEKKGSGGPDRD